MSLRLMKALAFILITRTPGESSLRLTRPDKSARVRKSSGFGFTSLSAHPTRTKITEAKINKNIRLDIITSFSKILNN
jgi:hypothetical protein